MHKVQRLRYSKNKINEKAKDCFFPAYHDMLHNSESCVINLSGPLPYV